MHKFLAAGVGGMGRGPDRQLDLNRNDRDEQCTRHRPERRRERERVERPEHRHAGADTQHLHPDSEYGQPDAWNQHHAHLRAFGQCGSRNGRQRHHDGQRQQYESQCHAGRFRFGQHHHVTGLRRADRNWDHGCDRRLDRSHGHDRNDGHDRHYGDYRHQHPESRRHHRRGHVAGRESRDLA